MEQTQLLDWDEEGDPNGLGSSGDTPKPVGRLHLLSSKHGPEKDFWIYPGENVIGRLESCQICLPVSSVSKAHAVIEVPAPDGPHLLYDKGSLNRTRRQRMILIPQVRYSLQDGDTLLFGDVGCQYFMLSPGSAPESPNDSMEVPPTQARVEASALVIEETPAPGRRKMGFGGVLVQDSDKEEEEEDVVNGAGRILPLSTGDGSVSSLQGGAGEESNLAASVFSSPSATVVPESDEESGELSVSDPPCPPLRLCFENQDAKPIPFENGGPPPLQREREAVESGATEVEAKDLPDMEEVTAKKQEATPPVPSLVENFQMDSDTDVEDEGEAGIRSKPSGSRDLMEADKALEVGSDTDVDEPVVIDSDAACQKTHLAVVDVSSDTDAEEVVEAARVPKAQQTAEDGDDDTDAEGRMENSSVTGLGSHGYDPQMEDGCKSMEQAEEDPHSAHPKGPQPGENEDNDTDVEEVISDPEVKAKPRPANESEDGDTDMDDTALKVENPNEALKTPEAALDSDGDTDVEMTDLVLENSDVAQPHSPHPIRSEDNNAGMEEIPIKGGMGQDSNHLDEEISVSAVEEIKNHTVQQQSSDEAVSEQSRSLDGKENPEITEKRSVLPQNQCLPVLSVDSDTDVEEEKEEVVEIQDVASEENQKRVAGPSERGRRNCPENHDIRPQSSPGPTGVEDSDTDVEVISPPHKEPGAEDSDTDVVVALLPGKPHEEQETQLLVCTDGEKSAGSAMEVEDQHGPSKEDEDTDAEGNKSCSEEDSNTDDDSDLALQATQCFLPSPRTETPRDTAATDSSGILEEEPTQDFRSPSVPTRLLLGKASVTMSSSPVSFPNTSECKSPLKEEDSDPDAYILAPTQAFCRQPEQLSEEPTQAFVIIEEKEAGLISQNPPKGGECSEQATQGVVSVSATRGQQDTSLSTDRAQPSSKELPCSEPVSQTAVDEETKECKKEEEAHSVQPAQSPPMGSSQSSTTQEEKRDSMTKEQVCVAVPEGGSVAELSRTQSEADGELEERSSVPVREAKYVDQVSEHSKEEPSQPEVSARGQRRNLRSSLTASPAIIPQGRSLRCRGHARSSDTERSEEPTARVPRRRGLRQLSSPTLYMGELEDKAEKPKEEEVRPSKRSKNGEPTVAVHQSQARCSQRELDAASRLKGEIGVATGSIGTRELPRRGKQRMATQPVVEQQLEVPRRRSSRRSNPSVSTPSPKGSGAAVKPGQDSPAHSTPSSGRRTRRQSTESKPVGIRSQSWNRSQASVGSGIPAPKVLFTGVIDEEGEQVVTELGGSLAESVFDCTHLVTDRVRRTVKFLCALARGIPIVTLDWLEKSRQNSFFLAPNSFLVRDAEQEKNFRFSLATSLRTAQQNGGLFQGYEIHVTPNVKPEPEHMKDIIKCSGGTFLPRMPRAYKDKRVVVSCPDDLPRCKPAQDAKVPITNSEFILTGILQQKVDLDAHRLDEVALSSPVSPAAPTTRASKRRAVTQTAPAPPSTAKRRR